MAMWGVPASFDGFTVPVLAHASSWDDSLSEDETWEYFGDGVPSARHHDREASPDSQSSGDLDLTLSRTLLPSQLDEAAQPPRAVPASPRSNEVARSLASLPEELPPLLIPDPSESPLLAATVAERLEFSPPSEDVSLLQSSSIEDQVTDAEIENLMMAVVDTVMVRTEKSLRPGSVNLSEELGKAPGPTLLGRRTPEVIEKVAQDKEGEEDAVHCSEQVLHASAVSMACPINTKALDFRASNGTSSEPLPVICSELAPFAPPTRRGITPPPKATSGARRHTTEHASNAIQMVPMMRVRHMNLLDEQYLRDADVRPPSSARRRPPPPSSAARPRTASGHPQPKSTPRSDAYAPRGGQEKCPTVAVSGKRPVGPEAVMPMFRAQQGGAQQGGPVPVRERPGSCGRSRVARQAWH